MVYFQWHCKIIIKLGRTTEKECQKIFDGKTVVHFLNLLIFLILLVFQQKIKGAQKYPLYKPLEVLIKNDKTNIKKN